MGLERGGCRRMSRFLLPKTSKFMRTPGVRKPQRPRGRAPGRQLGTRAPGKCGLAPLSPEGPGEQGRELGKTLTQNSRSAPPSLGKLPPSTSCVWLCPLGHPPDVYTRLERNQRPIPKVSPPWAALSCFIAGGAAPPVTPSPRLLGPDSRK